MKRLLVISAVLFASMTSVCQAAGYQEAIREGGSSDQAVVIQNSQISSQANTDDIDASGRAVVNAATVDISNGATVQNSEINAASDTGTIRAADDARVNTGGIRIH